MTDNTIEKMDYSLANNDLIALLLQEQKKQLEFPDEPKGNSLIAKIDYEIKKLEQHLQSIETSLKELQTSYSYLQKGWEKLFCRIDMMSQRLVRAQQKAAENSEILQEAYSNILAQQAKVIKTYRSYTILALIRHFIRPKLGILYQYDSRVFKVPKHYYKQNKLKKTPTISIVTPSFNQGRFIEQTILSVLDQNYPALQYIVQDGGSNDDTVVILKKYQSLLKHWESKKDLGQSNAINLGFRHATGEIMAYLNSDDVLLPGTLNYVANYFMKHPKVDVIYGHRVIINEHSQEIGRWVLPHHDSSILSWADYVPQETLFWRRSIWEKIGGNVDESFRFAMDWDLLLRFREAGAKFVRLPRFLGAFRVHVQQKTSASIAELGEEEMKRLRTRCHQQEVSHQEIRKNIRLYQIKHLIYHKLYRLGVFRY